MIAKRRIYYIPGIISLILLVPLSWIKLRQLQKGRDLRVMEITTSFKPTAMLRDTMYTQYYNTFPPTRDYLTFELTGDLSTDEIKLDSAQLRIREIEDTNDQTHGINFHFGDTAKYSALVRALDILTTEDINGFYLLYGRNLWYLGPRLPSKHHQVEPALICGTGFMRNYPESDLNEMRMLSLWGHWPLSVLFIALILLTGKFIKGLRPAA
jgi:hypothetical protein